MTREHPEVPDHVETRRGYERAEASSPGELPPQALPEPYMNLSIHTAPITQSVAMQATPNERRARGLGERR